MKISLVLKESIYDCKIKVTDSHGERDYHISATSDEALISITAEIFDSDCSITLIPVMPNTQAILDEALENNWKDKLAKKVTKFLSNSLNKTLLRVGCSYYIINLQDGDRLDICLQSYVFGTLDRFDILGLLPMSYVFFEISNFNERFKLTSAYEINRKDVLKYAKTFAFADVFGNGLFITLFTYPIQVGRIKRLTKNKRIFKTLGKFNNLSNTERQRFLEKQEKFFDR